MLSKLSRRFGEGVVNGALTARLGVAALEICRPMPFHSQPRPKTSALMRRAVSGLFDSDSQKPN
jgi:putative membrane protein